MRRDATRNTGASNTARGDKSAERKVVVRPDPVGTRRGRIVGAGVNERITGTPITDEAPDAAGVRGGPETDVEGKTGGYDQRDTKEERDMEEMGGNRAGKNDSAGRVVGGSGGTVTGAMESDEDYAVESPENSNSQGGRVSGATGNQTEDAEGEDH